MWWNCVSLRRWIHLSKTSWGPNYQNCRELNPRHSDWYSGTLPTELFGEQIQMKPRSTMTLPNYLPSQYAANVGSPLSGNSRALPAVVKGWHRYNRQRRLIWCNNHRHRLLMYYQLSFVHGESRFCVELTDGRWRVYRRRGDRFNDVCDSERNGWGGASVMMFDGIAYGTRRRGQTAQVLRPHSVPFFDQRQGFELQLDIARPHTARVSKNLFACTWNSSPLAR